jgi:hypothetical protein
VYYPTRGFFSSVEPVVHFGIGKATSVASAEIIWPDGGKQIIDNPGINTVHRITKNVAGKYEPPQLKHIFFEDISAKLPKEAEHKENLYIDFKREPLLHHKYSEEGPATAVGDVNGDGLDDVYLGGAAGFTGKLLLQQRNGSFTPSKTSVFEKDSLHEDVAALFFDANGDSPWIYCGQRRKRTTAAYVYQNGYINNGKGEFTKSQTTPRQFQWGCIAATDIDSDGDVDLFVGAK